MRSGDLRVPRRRIAMVRALLLAAIALPALRAGQLAVLDTRGAERAQSQSGARVELAPARGELVDRNGAEIAVTLPAPSVYAAPAAIADVEAAARALAPVLGRSREVLAERLSRRGPFVFLARWITPESARRVRELDLPGVGVIEEPRRVYPYGTLAASVVGFANIDGRGVRGIEQQEDDWLRGQPRAFAVERDGEGRLLATGRIDPLDAAGGDVALTLDAALQAVAEEGLREALVSSGARAGLVITLEPSSGEVLALAEQPEFDPNTFRSTSYARTRSKAFLDAFEPGSTLKMFLIAAALERGAIRAFEWIDCENGAFRVPGKTIHDLKPHPLLDVAGVLRVSSNIGATKIALRLGAADHFEALRAFGFGESTGSGFPDESSGVLRPWQGWRPVDQATIAFGQGIAVTPIQLAAASAALANGGLWVRPRLVAARRRPGEPWRALPSQTVRRVVSAETAQNVLGMLEEVVGSEGTARAAALPGLRVAGKTGTAEKFDEEAGRYDPERTLAWFVGIVPADAPRLVIVTALDEPAGPRRTGGALAAPLFRRVAEAQLAHLGLSTAPTRHQRRAESHTKPEHRRVETAARPDRLGPAASSRVPLPAFQGDG